MKVQSLAADLSVYFRVELPHKANFVRMGWRICIVRLTVLQP